MLLLLLLPQAQCVLLLPVLWLRILCHLLPMHMLPGVGPLLLMLLCHLTLCMFYAPSLLFCVYLLLVLLLVLLLLQIF
jgi:hypothetical protein